MSTKYIDHRTQVKDGERFSSEIVVEGIGKALEKEIDTREIDVLSPNPPTSPNEEEGGRALEQFKLVVHFRSAEHVSWSEGAKEIISELLNTNRD